MSAGAIVQCGAYFAAYASTITHATLYHRREIVSGLKNLIGRKSAFANSKDVHTRLMRSYREVPEWVYLIVLCASVGVGVAGIAVYPTNTFPAPVFYGVLLAVIFTIPCGIIKAITNVEVTLGVVSEVLGGLWFAGDVTAMVYMKMFGSVITVHALHFAQDLKLAHYTHIPPWVTFSSQMFATLASTFVCTAMLNYQMTKIPDVCAPGQKDHFTCPGLNSFFTASVLWGALGTKKIVGIGAIYNGLLWSFLIGVLLPVPFYFLSRKWKIFRYFHAPIFLSGGFIWSPYNLMNIWPAIPIAWLFSSYVKKRYLGWWSKYS